MLPEQIAGPGPALTEFLGVFRKCLGECRLREHFATYCRGLLSNLQRKSVAPIALAAGSTDDLFYRPKTAIALEQVRHAVGHGRKFDWLVYDEGYGKDPSFLLGLDGLGQIGIGEAPKTSAAGRSYPNIIRYGRNSPARRSAPWCAGARPLSIRTGRPFASRGKRSNPPSGRSRPPKCIWPAKAVRPTAPTG